MIMDLDDAKCFSLPSPSSKLSPSDHENRYIVLYFVVVIKQWIFDISYHLP